MISLNSCQSLLADCILILSFKCQLLPNTSLVTLLSSFTGMLTRRSFIAAEFPANYFH